jgi:hypothetical protein
MTHKLLLKVMRRLPEDYDPWGKVIRWSDPHQAYLDCSCGCKYFNPMEGQAGADWGVCMNVKSHRAGLLTFEHQGCQHFKLDPELKDDE